MSTETLKTYIFDEAGLQRYVDNNYGILIYSHIKCCFIYFIAHSIHWGDYIIKTPLTKSVMAKFVLV